MENDDKEMTTVLTIRSNKPEYMPPLIRMDSLTNIWDTLMLMLGDESNWFEWLRDGLEIKLTIEEMPTEEFDALELPDEWQ